MIVIFSYSGDAATPAIMDWLDHYACQHIRVNLEEEDFHNIKLFFKNGEKPKVLLKLNNGEVLDVDEVSYFFYRGGRFDFYASQQGLDELPGYAEKAHLQREFNTVTQFFYQTVGQKCLGNITQDPLNKLLQLKTAARVGLKIPDTLIVSEKSDLSNAEVQYKRLITKAIQENVLAASDKYHYSLKAQKLKRSQVSERFFPSLFQEQIKKEKEVRVFYLDGQFFSIAMKAQTDRKAPIDYRSRMNEMVCYKYEIAEDSKEKLKKMMNLLGLTTGSIDLLETKKAESYFLEVNPTGQFGWVSYWGNYCIERELAKYLKKKSDEKKGKVGAKAS